GRLRPIYTNPYNRLNPILLTSPKVEVRGMHSNRKMFIGVTLLAVLAALAIGQRALENRTVAEAAGVQAPMFEVDPLWPKPLPNHWIMGNTIGVSVDAQDHVWIIHRGGSL